MSGSNRGKRIAAWIAALLGLYLVVYAISFGLSEQSRIVEKADQSATEYSANATYQIEQSCRSIIAPKKAQCTRDAKAEHYLKARDNRREYDDLVAQQKSALWTSITGFAAITGMMLSVVGVYLVYATFAETRKANDIAKTAADDARRDANASRKALIQAERAIVEIAAIKQMLPPMPDTDSINLNIAVRNIGRSNAYNFGLFFSIQAEPIYSRKFKHKIRHNRICRPEKTMDFLPIKIRRKKTSGLYVVGCVEYTTTHDSTFTTYFCFRFLGDLVIDELGNTQNIILQSATCQKIPPDS